MGRINPIKIATETKDALLSIAGKYDDRFFGFHDQLGIGTGVIPQAAGLYSLLYLYKSFGKNINVFSEEDKVKVADISEKVINGIEILIKEEGYNARPIISAESSRKWIGRNLLNEQDSSHYLGAVTWVLSLYSLCRGLLRDNKLVLTNINLELLEARMIETLEIIVRSQICIDNDDCGAWGFSNIADRISLYFTYIVAASLNDFYEDIIANDKGIDDPLRKRIEDKKVDGLSLEDKKLEGRSLFECIEKARARLQKWIMKYNFPFMSLLSSCKLPKNLAIDMNQTGLIELDDPGTKKAAIGLDVDENYNYIYYALYSFDMFISSGTFDKLNKGNNGFSINEYDELKYFYLKNELFSTSDYEYICDQSGDSSENNEKGFFNLAEKLMEQSVHSMRESYFKIVRTGGYFWESKDSAHNIKLEMSNKNNKSINENIIKDCKLKKEPLLSDPVIQPLFLRVNYLFCDRITRESDRIITQIFEDIISDRITSEKVSAPKNEENEHIFGKSELLNLWDPVHFNLLITEKSVEAIVDYDKYLKDFKLVKFNPSENEALANDEIELRIKVISEKEKRINELESALNTIYTHLIKSDNITNDTTNSNVNNNSISDMKKEIAELKARVDAFDPDELFRKMFKDLDGCGALQKEDAKYKATKSFVTLFEKAFQGYVYNIIHRKSLGLEKNKVYEKTANLIKQYESLIKDLADDCQIPKNSLDELYFTLKKLSNSGN